MQTGHDVSLINPSASKVSRRTEGFVVEGDTELYCLPSYDRLPPFLMTLTSDSDHWMYLSSFGGLTAGRYDEEHCLFPYETEDRLHEAHGVTGPQTLLRVLASDGTELLWEPFDHRRAARGVERNLYRTPLCNRVIFEEVHRSLGLVFRYQWAICEQFGFVRTASVRNIGKAPRSIDLLDGLLNVMPQGVKLRSQQTSSCLVDAYKQSELDQPAGLAIYALTSMIQDRAEPAECLKATTAWSRGLAEPEIFLSAECVAAFREGKIIRPEEVVAGKRGAFILQSSFPLPAGELREWDIACDVDQDHVAIERAKELLLRGDEPREQVAINLRRANENLRRQVASADGLQCSGDRRATANHAASVLFNNMRGGVPLDQHNVSGTDFAEFVKSRNAPVAQECRQMLEGLPARIRSRELLPLAEACGADLLRLAYEYLPLTFGRRHGDPSRPWNHFSVRLKKLDGSPAIQYQGNWRDIFQNWEALALSFPEYIESFIAKFVNASTVDGFNPYHIGSDGINWETHHPDDPWSNIGYWGDHQIIYLLRLLELSGKYHPGALPLLLDREIFTYADVPYRLKPFESIVDNPNETIDFDTATAAEAARRLAAIGADGKLLPRGDGGICHVNLFEKLLVPMLSKLSNLVVDGGIWMNTQRPEWNDANNALVGEGLSVVTVFHLRRYLAFFVAMLEPLADRSFLISSDVATWMDRLHEVFTRHAGCLDAAVVSDHDRRKILVELGQAFGGYRKRVYERGLSGTVERTARESLDMLRVAMRYLDHTIRANGRPDGLFHSYNLMRVESDQIVLRRLDQMLEGQVAALTSGVLSATESADLIESLFRSRMFREDQQSFMLYPRRTVPRFAEKNKLAADAANSVELIRRLVEAGDRSVVAPDVKGTLRFNGSLRNARDVNAALDRLASAEQWSTQVARDRSAVLELFERVFHHRVFIGRAAAMFAYEGIGCVYWHMVSKLLLATQETVSRAVLEHSPDAVIQRLIASHERIRSGLGFNKSARQYGAFPTEPYSHSSASGGARQPGMTGQVKEQIITRFGELGVSVLDGRIRFAPRLLRRAELLKHQTTWSYFAVDGRERQMLLAADSCAFTLCQVPIVYRFGQEAAGLRVTFSDGATHADSTHTLEERISSSLLSRTGEIERVEILIPSGLEAHAQS